MNSDLNISEWTVVDDNSFSDHKYISIKCSFGFERKIVKFRNPRNTNWKKFNKEVVANVQSCEGIESPVTTEGLEESVKAIHDSFKKALRLSCRLTKCSKSKLPSYFTIDLLNQRRLVRSLFNDA